MPVAQRLSKRAMVGRLMVPPVQAKQTARNTLDYTLPDGTRKIRLHDTDILTFKPDGSFRIDTGGWNTLTTRDRLNRFLPPGYRVQTQRGTLTLSGIPFMRVIDMRPDTTMVSDIAPNEADALTKKINAYMKEWREHGLPSVVESGGDPWIFGTDKVEEDVMLDWVETKYVHRKMYELALRHAGHTPTSLAYWMRNADRDGMPASGYRVIRRYVRACLGLAA